MGDTTSVVTGGTLRLSVWLASIQLCPDSQNKWSVFLMELGGGHNYIFTSDLTANLQPFNFNVYPSLLIPVNHLNGIFLVCYSVLLEL